MSQKSSVKSQVLGVGTDCNDAVPSVLLFFDQQR